MPGPFTGFLPFPAGPLAPVAGILTLAAGVLVTTGFPALRAARLRFPGLSCPRPCFPLLRRAGLPCGLCFLAQGLVPGR